MTETARERALAYLEGHNVTTLGTFGPEGPWAAAVFYASEGFTIFFLSSPSSRHGRNLAVDPRAAATVQEDYKDWPEIKDIQLEGRAVVLAGDERERAIGLYTQKFPMVGHAAEVGIRDALSRVAWYRLVSERAYFIDNALGFGHRDQIL